MDLDDFTSRLHTIHIRLQQRTAKKTITSIQGIHKDIDIHKLTKRLKRAFNCTGTVVNDEIYGIVIQLSGDWREHCRTFLVNQEICINGRSQASLDVGARASALDSEGREASLLRHVITSPARPVSAAAIYKIDQIIVHGI